MIKDDASHTLCTMIKVAQIFRWQVKATHAANWCRLRISPRYQKRLALSTRRSGTYRLSRVWHGIRHTFCSLLPFTNYISTIIKELNSTCYFPGGTVVSDNLPGSANYLFRSGHRVPSRISFCFSLWHAQFSILGFGFCEIFFFLFFDICHLSSELL